MGELRRPRPRTRRIRPWRILGVGAGVPAAASGALLLVGLVVPNLVVWVPPWDQSPGTRDRVRLVAHRGGVVEAERPEGSLAALRGAVARGYAGVELDVREARDGVPVVHHDASLARGYAEPCEAHGFAVCAEGDGDCVEQANAEGIRPCAVGEMTAEELRRVTGGFGTVVALEVFLNRVGRTDMDVMLDFKEALSPRALDQVDASLSRHMAGRRVYLIGSLRSKRTMVRRGQGRFGAPMHLVPLAAAYAAVTPQRLFLFQSALGMGPREILYGARVNMEVIASLNWHHLGGRDAVDRERAIARAHDELRRLHDAGLRTFQIDSDFDGAFRNR